MRTVRSYENCRDGHLSPLAGRGRIALAIRVRGSFVKCDRNRFKNARHVAQDLIIPESQDAVVVVDKPFVADSITSTVCVLPAINLNDEATFAAGEVNGVGTHRLLSNKLLAIKPARPQPAPQRRFGIGGISSQASGSLRSYLPCTAHAALPPHPDCFAIRPLPARGERLSSCSAP